MNDILLENENEIFESDFIIPATCLTFSEMSLYFAEYANNVLNELMEEIGNSELKSLQETGTIVVYEGESLREIKIKFQVAVKKIWAANKKFWEKVKSTLEADSKVKYDPISKETIDSLDPEKVYGKTHKFFKEKDIKFSKNADKILDQSNKTFNKLITLEADQDKIRKARKEIEKILLSTISGIDGVSTNRDMKKALKNKLIGDSVDATKKFIEKNIDEIYSYVSAGKCTDDIDYLYKQDYDMYQSILDRIEKDFDQDFPAVVTQWSLVILDIIDALHSCYAIECDVYKRRYVEYRNIIAKLSSIQSKMVKESFDSLANKYEDIE